MSESYTDIYDPYYYPQPVYTQAELIDMVRATLQRKFNADYSFQTHVQGDYSVNTETVFDEKTKNLVTVLTVKSLKDSPMTRKNIKLRFDYNKDYEFAYYNYNRSIDPDDNFWGEIYPQANEPFDKVTLIYNNNIDSSPYNELFNTEYCYTREYLLPDYVEENLTQLMEVTFGLGKRLETALTRHTITNVVHGDEARDFLDIEDGFYENYIYHIERDPWDSQYKDKRLRYYHSPILVAVDNDFDEKPTSITIINNKFASNENDRLIHFNVEKQDALALAPINATIQAIQNRPTPAQEEIAFQVIGNRPLEVTGHGFVSTFLPDELIGTNTMQVRIHNKFQEKTQDFYVTAINETQYRITDPFDTKDLPDSINVYGIVTRTKKNDYDSALARKLKDIVAKDLEPESTITVTKQKETKKSTSKIKQLNLFDDVEDELEP